MFKRFRPGVVIRWYEYLFRLIAISFVLGIAFTHSPPPQSFITFVYTSGVILFALLIFSSPDLFYYLIDFSVQRTKTLFPPQPVVDDSFASTPVVSVLDLFKPNSSVASFGVSKDGPYLKAIFQLMGDLDQLNYLGMHPSGAGPKIIEYPHDPLADELLTRLGPRADVAQAKCLQRVNPTNVRKVAYLRKFNAPQKPVSEPRLREFEAELDSVFNDLGASDSHFLKKLRSSLLDPSYDDIVVNRQAATGDPLDSLYPLRGAALEAGKQLASEQFQKGVWNFDHYWRTAGRGKLIPRGKDTAARMVEYPGIQDFLNMAKYGQPFTHLVVSKYGSTESALGHSWFHMGALKMRDRLIKEAGLSSKLATFFVLSLDVSSWDTSVPRSLLELLRDRHVRVVSMALAGDPLHDHWCKTIKFFYDDMINAKLVLPLGFIFQTLRGMKSGWSLTAVDNTILHMVIARLFFKRFYPDIRKSVLLYGDDNFSVLNREDISYTPANVKTLRQRLSSFYGMFRFSVPPDGITISDNLEDVDFLSKYIVKHTLPSAKETYVSWKPSEETYARLIYPEIFRLDKPTERAASTAARFIGHLIDNFFNIPVRDTLLLALKVLKERYDVDSVDMTDHFIRRYGILPSSPIAGVWSTVPDVSKLYSLYGYDGYLLTSRLSKVSVPRDISVSFKYRRLNSIYMCDTELSFDNTSISPSPGLEACLIIHDMSEERENIKQSRNYRFKKIVAPFISAPFASGNAGCKLGEGAMRFDRAGFGLQNCFRILDLGSHPGSALSALLFLFRTALISAVSLFPEIDRKNGKKFCYKAPVSNRLTLYEMDVNAFLLSLPASVTTFDFINVDLAVGRDMGFTQHRRKLAVFEFEMVSKVVLRLRKLFPRAKLLIKLRHDSAITRQFLYKLYSASSFFDLYKSKFSYPWNNEYHVAFAPSFGGDIVKRSNFMSSLNYFFNDFAFSRLAWASFRDFVLSNNKELHNPAKRSRTFQRRLSKYLPTEGFIVDTVLRGEFYINIFSLREEKKSVSLVESREYHIRSLDVVIPPRVASSVVDEIVHLRLPSQREFSYIFIACDIEGVLSSAFSTELFVRNATGDPSCVQRVRHNVRTFGKRSHIYVSAEPYQTFKIDDDDVVVLFDCTKIPFNVEKVFSWLSRQKGSFYVFFLFDSLVMETQAPIFLRLSVPPFSFLHISSFYKIFDMACIYKS